MCGGSDVALADAEREAVDEAKFYALLVVCHNDLIHRMQRFLEVFAWAGFHLSGTTTSVPTASMPMTVSFKAHQPEWMVAPERIVDYIVQYFDLTHLKVTWTPVKRYPEDRLFDRWRLERGNYADYPVECRLKVAHVEFAVP